jgi:pimeloyl-ACP methyl ester carboxylesterase
MDLRGHGLSDKPREGYTDSRLWAEDVDSAIRALSQVQVMANTGHAAFWDNADAFNRQLRVFTSSL